MNEPSLRIENLSHTYDNGEGVKAFEFELQRGDFLAVIGSSGAGKSTLINTILGILKRDTGKVLISDNIEMNRLSFSPQNQAIDWYLNVYDNIYMGALFSNVDNARQATEDMIRLIGLQGKEDSDPTDLSGGQLQRVQLARQLVSESDILFLDEPTNGLDVVTSEQILSYLQELSNRGVTCIVSSHDLDILEKFCNKVLLIENGMQVFFGDLTEFVKSYNEENEYVIELYGGLPDDTKKMLTECHSVLNWNPLTVALEDDKHISSVLKMLIDNGGDVASVRKDKKSLKEIILDNSRQE